MDNGFDTTMKISKYIFNTKMDLRLKIGPVGCLSVADMKKIVFGEKMSTQIYGK
jgi:hypothetical protein